MEAAAAAGPSTDELLTARFNQEHSCLAVGTRRGYQIFACEPFTSCHASTDGAGIAVLEMLHSSSLVALVSAGERPGDSPRRLRLWNTRSNASICDLNFSTAVLAVRMNKARLLAVLEAKLHIFELATMKLMHTLETTLNPRGLGELCADAETCHCVVPAAQQGQVLYFDALQLHSLNTVQAHKGPLGCMCLSSAGHLLATASEKGTVIRIHSFPQGALLHTFRRGSLPATICSLSFSPGVLLGGKREQSGTWLCAASASGTVHVWRLDAQRQSSTSSAVSSLMPIISGERDFASVKVKSCGGRCQAAIRDSRPDGQPEAVHHSLYVWTDRGVWYSYRLNALKGGDCVLQDEQRLLPAAC